MHAAPRLMDWLAGQVMEGAILSIETVLKVESCRLQPVTALVASTLKVVATVRLPVGRLIDPPVPATAIPTRLLPELFLSW